MWDPFGDQHMGNIAEACAKKFDFSREAQDDYAVESYRRAQEAHENGCFDVRFFFLITLSFSSLSLPFRFLFSFLSPYPLFLGRN